MTEDKQLHDTLVAAVDRDLGNRSTLVGGRRNGTAQPPLADMLAAVTQHNDELKANLDRAIADLRALREML